MADSRENFHVYVNVKPLSNTSRIKQENDSLKVYLKSPPVDGKANKELLYLLSDYFDVKRSNIKIVKGKYARKKVIRINKKGE